MRAACTYWTFGTCPDCNHEWRRHTGRRCSARDTDASGNYDVCDCIAKPPPVPTEGPTPAPQSETDGSYCNKLTERTDQFVAQPETGSAAQVELPPLDDQFWKWRDKYKSHPPGTSDLFDESRKCRERQLLSALHTIAQKDKEIDAYKDQIHDDTYDLKALRAELSAANERIAQLTSGIERIRVVASGEEQIADDDTEGMSIIDIMAQKFLKGTHA